LTAKPILHLNASDCSSLLNLISEQWNRGMMKEQNW